MQTLFIDQPSLHTEYTSELNEVYKKINKNGDVKRIALPDLSTDYLLKNAVDVIVSNGLSNEWLYTFKGLKIITVIFDKLEIFNSLADLVIDYQSNDNTKFFTSSNYSIRQNSNMAIEEIINVIELMKWDTDFFGFPIAYLGSRQLTESIVYRIDRYVKKNKVRLIEYLCNCHDNKSVSLAEKNGFHFTDIRLTFDLIIKQKYEISIAGEFTFGLATKDHIKELKHITADLYKDSRYFFDGNFDTQKINEFFSSWVEKAVLGTFDHMCYCFFYKGQPIALCTVRLRDSFSASIGLFGIADGYQGKGLGKQLLYGVFNELLQKKYTKLQVVTQGRNYNAQRLYQSAGFKTVSTELWYHKWI